MDNLIEIENINQFDEIICNLKEKMVIYFNAPWCKLCHFRVTPKIKELQKKYKNIKFYTANIDNIAINKLKEKYHIKYIPTLILFYLDKMDILRGITIVSNNPMDIENLLINAIINTNKKIDILKVNYNLNNK